MAENKVVVRPKVGNIEKGSTGAFRPNKESFHLQMQSGEVSAFNVEDLKAVFFVKDYAGQPDYDETYQDSIPGGGRKFEVTFKDGEKVIGFATSYSNQRPGWFLVPADKASNNLRVYVVSSAVDEVRPLS